MRASTLVVLLPLSVWFSACSGQSPAQPTTPAEAVAGPGMTSAGSGTPGSYVLSFADYALTEVTSLPVGEELVLKAHVDDSSGLPAQKGSVAFQVCRRGGRSLAQTDPVPYSECVGGSAVWATLIVMKLGGTSCPDKAHPGMFEPGSACVDFGSIQHPRVVGFRFKYTSQGSDIANHTVDPMNFEWTAY